MPALPDVDAVIAELQPRPELLRPAVFRLARRVPRAQAVLSVLAETPLERALLGLSAPPGPHVQPTLGDKILACQARLDQGLAVDPAVAAALEAEAEGDLEWWVPAARVHLLVSPAREARVRMALSHQELPYVFPGELHPLQVALLAGGDRVVQALHVDWLRKLTEFAADALILDGRALGLWFWPILRFLDERKLGRPLKKLARARKLPPGALGMLAAYADRIGAKAGPLLAAGDEVDRVVWALALASVRPRA